MCKASWLMIQPCNGRWAGVPFAITHASQEVSGCCCCAHVHCVFLSVVIAAMGWDCAVALGLLLVAEYSQTVFECL